MKNMIFTLKPLEGICWNEYSISLENTKKEVEKVLGQPDIVENSYYYFDNELRFDFDNNEKVKFIEFLGGMEGTIQPQIYGVNAFTTEAEELYKTLKEHNVGENVDSENGYSYTFHGISVGVYREIIPEDMEEMIEEMKEEGVQIEGNEDLEVEKKRAYHWATIGIGRSGYYE